MRLLAISGSLRAGSYNRALLAAAALERPEAVDVVLWDDLAAIPPFNEDVDRVPPPVERLVDEIARADAVLFATPEYNASVPGALKNALDWASRPFEANALRSKPVAVVGASPGMFGAIWAQAELRKILRTIGAKVDDRQLVVAHAHRAFAPDGRLRDPQLAAVLRSIVDALVPAAERRCAA